MELLSLPSPPQISCAVLWNLEQVRVGVVMAGRQLPLKTWKYSSFIHNKKVPKSQTVPESKSVPESETSPKYYAAEVWDVSCGYAQTPAVPGQDLEVLLFRPKNNPKTR